MNSRRLTGTAFGCRVRKQDTDTAAQIERLSAMPQTAEVRRALHFARAGAQGEQALLFELKNSGLDLIVLQDLFLLPL